MSDYLHAYVGDCLQRIELRTPSGLQLEVCYHQGIRQFSIHLIKLATARQIARGKPSLIVLSHWGAQSQLPSTPRDSQGCLSFRLGSTSVEVHLKSFQALHDWLVHLNRLYHKAALRDDALATQGAVN